MIYYIWVEVYILEMSTIVCLCRDSVMNRSVLESLVLYAKIPVVVVVSCDILVCNCSVGSVRRDREVPKKTIVGAI